MSSFSCSSSAAREASAAFCESTLSCGLTTWASCSRSHRCLLEQHGLERINVFGKWDRARHGRSFCAHDAYNADNIDYPGVASFALASRFRLTTSSAACNASIRCSCDGIRTRNFSTIMPIGNRLEDTFAAGLHISYSRSNRLTNPGKCLFRGSGKSRKRREFYAQSHVFAIFR